MAVAGWVFLLVALPSLSFAEAHYHSGETETYYVSVGHLFVLKCITADVHTNVTWSREGTNNLSLPAGVEVRGGLLYFLPVQMSHNGPYTCKKRDNTRLSRITFWLSVSSGVCPEPPENKSISVGVNGGLHCKQTDILSLNDTRSIQWMKDCQPLERPESFSVDNDGFLRLPAVSKGDAGKYTCQVNISLDGRKYTSARSVQLTVDDDDPMVFQLPEIVYPQEEVVVVEVGARAELKCIAYLGSIEDPETRMHWTIDSAFAESHEGLTEAWEHMHDNGKVYGVSTLSIPKVPRQFLNVPIHCYVTNPAEQTTGLMWLQEADHSAFHTHVALCLTASLAILALAAAFLLFKVDLVLAYRKLLRHFAKQQAPDGKLYDAYVSFLHPSILSSAETASFALQILPEELEKQHGYSLFIRGRDDCPGEAVHDVIATRVHQCRRLIIIVSPQAVSSTNGKTEEEPLNDNQNQLCYEQKIGLHDALTKNDPRVILVEIDGPVDYSCLPESLRYIKRKQGSLKWKKPALGTHKLTKLCSNRNFWKNLRYHMPSVPAGRIQTIV
ncbi:interleukin-1 receptor type 1 [Dicentrarchus labrax]|uniref:interleukin-1 receptor type 1 n=1 Tax=Dicentrarchus labrax TaxID=13489 RepID=UPI001637D9A1|nr:interleukin-1 receptor type 1 [Dicentrarchus labrax]XP_051260769.1 interleukin-1 receptor type 1 [Dicentrarchus labrax]